MTHAPRLALLVAVFAGCGGEAGKLAEYLKAQRPAVEQNLAALPKVAEQVRGLPPLENEGGPGPLTFAVDAFVGAHAPATGSLAYAEDLADPDELGYVWGRLDDAGALNQCASLLHRGHLAYDPAQPAQTLLALDLREAQERLPRCAALRFLLVIRTLEFLQPSVPVQATRPFVPIIKTLDLDAVPAEPPPPPPVKKARRGRRPVPAPAPPPAEASDEAPLLTPTADWGEIRYLFDGGFVRGEVLLFTLPAGELLGGARFDAQSSVKVKGDGEAVQTDFTAQVKASLRSSLRRAFPSLVLGDAP
jgi:hypothetical protein